MNNFFKIHACGNNFLVFFKNKQIIFFKKILNKVNLNCDQILIIKNINFINYIINIKIFNNNFSEALNCGNGIRCLSWFFLIKKKNFFLNFKLKKNYIYSFKSKNIYTIYKISKIKFLFIKIKNFFLKVYFVNLINLHIILFIKNINSIYLKKIYIKIKKYFGDCYNIEFLKLLNKNNFFIRIFERGVGETYSCGSGIISSSFCIKKKLLKNNYKINSIGGECYTIFIKKFISIYGKVNFCFFGKI
ncbi:diaminopimelate epimerase [Candidatus Carsonella ruddii]|uniref:Diaminopimelate epimerase n=1 Tax=Candidatus Carsonella ruddii HC isolate Thao2000 TaxID=1202538 RepID=J3YQ81_CARRU|nr:diaminopimelate epimerase [Candidatus Carsonella ruddii]AFP84043.1 diaminopimelate epimerase [Candidatus Carsonella ruddii HC isolate Thao2000]